MLLEEQLQEKESGKQLTFTDDCIRVMTLEAISSGEFRFIYWFEECCCWKLCYGIHNDSFVTLYISYFRLLL